MIALLDKMNEPQRRYQRRAALTTSTLLSKGRIMAARQRSLFVSARQEISHELLEDLVSQGLTQEEIAGRIGYGMRHVGRLLKKHSVYCPRGKTLKTCKHCGKQAMYHTNCVKCSCGGELGMISDGKMNCSNCKQLLPIEAFTLLRKNGGQRRNVCRQCGNKITRKVQRAYRDNNAGGRFDDSPKTCSRCKEILPADSFSLCSYNKSGLQSECRDCMVCRQHGITKAEWRRMYDTQAGKCAICNTLPVEKLKRTKVSKIKRRTSLLVVDHCHSTGLIRGLICQGCNTAIGLLGDTSQDVAKAVAYLSRSEGTS